MKEFLTEEEKNKWFDENIRNSSVQATIQQEINHYLFCTESSKDERYKNFEPQFNEWQRDLEYRIHVQDGDIEQ